MSQITVLSLDNLEAAKITLGKIRDNKGGLGKNANIPYNGGRFNLALGGTRFPFGATAKPAEYRQGDRDQFTMQCEISKTQTEKLEALDQRMIDCCLASEEFLTVMKLNGKQRCREVVESKYFSLLKYSKDKDGKIKTEYNPTIRVAIPNGSGEKSDGFNCDFFLSKNGTSSQVAMVDQPTSENHITKMIGAGSTGAVLLTCSLWISSSGFGITLKASQIKVEHIERQTRSLCLLDDFLKPSSASKPIKASSSTIDEDEDLMSEISE